MRLFFLTLLFTLSLFAHQNSYSFINFDFKTPTPTLEWGIGTSYIEKVILLDDDKDKNITLQEVNNHKNEIIKYINKKFILTLDNKEFYLDIKELKVKIRDEEVFVLINIPLKRAKEIDIKYSLFFDIDPLYRCFIKVIDEEKESLRTLFSVNKHIKIPVKSHHVELSQNLKEFFVEGIWHIWIGVDHILFLLMLIIPSVKNSKDFRPILINIIKIVTAFSIAHSITLTLSALEIVSISSKFIEITIALSVLLTALNNIFEKVKGFFWQIAFAFGLIHGFGFANALAELELTKDYFVYLLAVFNLGIEFGQLMIVSFVLPILYKLRDNKIYLIGILKVGSLLTAILSIWWIFDRI